jgi:hypothetical protein
MPLFNKEISLFPAPHPTEIARSNGISGAQCFFMPNTGKSFTLVQDSPQINLAK